MVEQIEEPKVPRAAPLAAPVVAPEVKPEAAPEPKPEPEAKVAEPAPAPEAPKVDWREQRIAKLTAQLNEERAKNAAKAAPPAEGKKPEESQGDFEARVGAAAARIAEEKEFNTRSEAAAQAAKAAYGPEFDKRLTAIQSTVNSRDPIEVAAYMRFISTALDSGQLGKVVFLLGEDLGRAADLMAMSPSKMAMEVAKLALVAEDKGVSKVADPLRTVEANGQADRVEIDPSDPTRADKLSTAEWMRRRAPQLKQLYGR